jgi:hypothetical protein
MKLDFNFPLKDLTGKDIENTNVGKILANTLANANKGNSIKMMDWALKLYNGNPLEIDQSDADILEGFIDTADGLSNLMKHPMLRVIKDAKSAEKESK